MQGNVDLPYLARGAAAYRQTVGTPKGCHVLGGTDLNITRVV
jgi:hypothetical protein